MQLPKLSYRDYLALRREFWRGKADEANRAELAELFAREKLWKGNEHDAV